MGARINRAPTLFFPNQRHLHAVRGMPFRCSRIANAPSHLETLLLVSIYVLTHCPARYQPRGTRPQWVIVPGVEVIQPRAIVILPDEAFSRVEATRVVARVAIGAEELVAFHGGPTCGIGEGGDQTTLRIGQVELGPIAI